jgi:hypothetical protein
MTQSNQKETQINWQNPNIVKHESKAKCRKEYFEVFKGIRFF